MSKEHQPEGEKALMEWKNDTKRYSAGEILYLGHWPVGGAHHDTTVPRGTKAKIRASCSLPGLKDCQGYFETLEEAKARVEKAVRHWIKKGGLALASQQETSAP